jgi:hypothetical protein
MLRRRRRRRRRTIFIDVTRSTRLALFMTDFPFTGN